MVHEFVRVTKLIVTNDFYAERVRGELEHGRYAEAAVCIVNGRMFDRFDCH